MARVDYIDFQGLLDSGEFSDFNIFKNAYNVSFDIPRRVGMPPLFEPYKSYKEKILKFEKIKFSKFWDGEEVDFLLGKYESDYVLKLNNRDLIFSTFPRAWATTISESEANLLGLNLLSVNNENKIYFLDPPSGFYQWVQKLIEERGYFYLFVDTWDYYLNNFFIVVNYSFETYFVGNPPTMRFLLTLQVGGQRRFRRYNLNFTQGIPDNVSNLYSKTAYIFDCNLFPARWNYIEKGVLDYRLYPFANGISIHRLWGNLEYDDGVGNLIYYDYSGSGDSLNEKRGIYMFNPNIQPSDWNGSYNMFPYVTIHNLINYSVSLSDVKSAGIIYAYAFTALLKNGEEIPLGAGAYLMEGNNRTQVLRSKIFITNYSMPQYVYKNPLEFLTTKFWTYEFLPLMIDRINIYVAEIVENFELYSSDGSNIHYYDAEKVPDSFFVLRGYWKMPQGNAIKLDTDITLAELPVSGSKWLVKLRDEISYSNTIIGVGENNGLYEGHTLAEGSMIDIIPEESAVYLNIKGNIEKIVNYTYRLLVFTQEELWVVDPEKNYQVVNKLSVGLYDRKSVVETPHGVIFVGSDGNVYITDGLRLKDIGFAIKEKLKLHIHKLIFAVYNSSRNEIWLNCGRWIYVYHFEVDKWSVYGAPQVFVGYSNFSSLYLYDLWGKIYRVNYLKRGSNGCKTFLITYKNELGYKGVKILNYIEVDIVGQATIVFISDRFVRGYKLQGGVRRLVLSGELFKWLQVVLFSNSDTFELRRLSVDYSPTELNYETGFSKNKFDGAVLTCFNEFGASRRKRNVVMYSQPLASDYKIMEYDVSYVYDSVLRGYTYETGYKPDLEYIYNEILALGLKRVSVLVTALWTTLNSVNGDEDADFSLNARIYTNPILPPDCPYIVPVISYKTYQFGRGGIVGSWMGVELDSSEGGMIYRNRNKIWELYWVFYNGSPNKARKFDGNPLNWVKFDSYAQMKNSTNMGWYWDRVNGDLYIKVSYSDAKDVIPDYENISVVIKNPLSWRASDGEYWNYNQSIGNHFRMLHPTAGGSIDDDTLLELISFLKERGLEVAFYPFLMVATSIGHGWRGYIKVFNEGVAEAYRNWILHYAKLFVDNKVIPHLFIIGSEMKELEKDSGFASFMASLANQVRSLLPSVKLTYAMDWGSVAEILSGSTSRNDFENFVWSKMDYLGLDLYFPLLKSSDPYIYNAHKYISNLKGFIESWQARHNKKVIVTEYGISSLHRSLYEPYVFPPNLPSGSDGSSDEVAQMMGYWAYHNYFNELIKKGIVHSYYFYNLDIRPFPSYPDAVVFDWNYRYFYYVDFDRYATGHNIVNKLVQYVINEI